MKYFKKGGEVFAFESDGSQDELITDEMVALTDDEVIEVTKREVKAVSMRQARLALLKKGYLSQVETIINNLPDEERLAAQIEWEFAGVVDRDEALTRVLVAGLNLTEQQENELFELAATL